MKNFFKTRARIVEDKYLGYEAQIRPWWCPFYFQLYINTHETAEHAEAYLRKGLRRKTIKYVEIEE